jgi:hypothetical protein
MELPRGSFHSMHKEIRLHNLLHELRRLRFTGHVSISSLNGESAIVVTEGSCILAKKGTRTGNPAWKEITKNDSEQVSAVLSELTSLQVALALEFNPGALVNDDTEPPEKPIQKSAVKKQSKEPSPERPVITRETAPNSLLQREGIYFQRKAKITDLKNKTQISGDTSETVDRDLECLDQMDLQALTNEVKKNSTRLIKGLELEYLLEEGKT